MAKNDSSSATGTDNPEQLIFKLFGEYPKDILKNIEASNDVLEWLAQLFITISDECQKGDHYRSQKLADAGVFLATDRYNVSDCLREKYEDHMKAAGVILAS